MKKSEAEDIFDKAVELQKLVRHSGLTYLPLHSDVTYSIKQWQSDPSQFWCRTSIRCLCAAVEATLFSFRKMAEKMAAFNKIQFEPKELEILSEVKINGGRKFLPFPDAIKESFRLFAKAAGTIAIINYGANFLDLCNTFEVRNRLMHPKKPFDVEVNEENIKAAERGIIWFNKTYSSLLDQCHAHFGKNIEMLKRKSEV